MSLRTPLALTLALAAGCSGAATAVAATADSISVDWKNSKSERRVTLAADVQECDGTGGYGCYTATFSVFSAAGKRIVSRPLVFDGEGSAATRYRWTCRHTGILRWRIEVSDGAETATRGARFRVSRC